MDYKLFGDYITLQALFKEVGIIQSGGAIKAFLDKNKVYVNGELENRRGKKLRIADQVNIPSHKVDIILTEPSLQEKETYLEEKVEKERVAKLVKEMNKGLKKTQSTTNKKSRQKQTVSQKKSPVRFPGT